MTKNTEQEILQLKTNLETIRRERDELVQVNQGLVKQLSEKDSLLKKHHDSLIGNGAQIALYRNAIQEAKIHSLKKLNLVAIKILQGKDESEILNEIESLMDFLRSLSE